MSTDFIAAVDFLRIEDARGALSPAVANAVAEVLDHVDLVEREHRNLERLLSEERVKHRDRVGGGQSTQE